MTAAWILCGILIALLVAMFYASAKLGAVAKRLDGAEGELEPSSQRELAASLAREALEVECGITPTTPRPRTDLANAPTIPVPPPPELMPVSLVVYGKNQKGYVQRLDLPDLIYLGAYTFRRLDTGDELSFPEAKELHDTIEKLLARRHTCLFDVVYKSERHEFR